MDDEEQPPRKGRSNAILTYETLTEFSSKLTRVETLVETLLSQRSEADNNHKDHELRIRVLELATRSSGDSAAASHRVWLFVYGAVVGLPSLAISLVTLFSLIKGH